MASLKAKLRGTGWTAFALDSRSDESEDVLASWLVALGYDAEDLPELRRLIRGSCAAAARDRRAFANASDSSLYLECCLKGGCRRSRNLLRPGAGGHRGGRFRNCVVWALALEDHAFSGQSFG